jgi:hypothetical protein
MKSSEVWTKLISVQYFITRCRKSYFELVEPRWRAHDCLLFTKILIDNSKVVQKRTGIWESVGVVPDREIGVGRSYVCIYVVAN